jgi:hypothetical protein
MGKRPSEAPSPRARSACRAWGVIGGSSDTPHALHALRVRNGVRYGVRYTPADTPECIRGACGQCHRRQLSSGDSPTSRGPSADLSE